MSRYFADMADNPFLAAGLMAGLLASIACGAVGPWMVYRRMVFLAGAIAHIAIGGVGASIYAAARWPALFGWLQPLVGATFASVAAALLLAWLTHRSGERLDAMIGALWSTGMAGAEAGVEQAIRGDALDLLDDVVLHPHQARAAHGRSGGPRADAAVAPLVLVRGAQGGRLHEQRPLGLPPADHPPLEAAHREAAVAGALLVAGGVAQVAIAGLGAAVVAVFQVAESEIEVGWLP